VPPGRRIFPAAFLFRTRPNQGLNQRVQGSRGVEPEKISKIGIFHFVFSAAFVSSGVQISTVVFRNNDIRSSRV
jgi:hypothetical protein